MASVFAEIMEDYSQYFADSLYPLLFFLCLALIFLHPGAKKERSALFWSNLLFLGLIFCPLSAYLFMKMIGELVYWRMFWMLTVSIVIPYAGVQWITGFSRKTIQALAGLAAVAVIVFSGQFIFSDSYFGTLSNPFKLPSEVIYVSEIISAHAEEQNIESPKAATTEFLSAYIRQYDAGIRLAYGRNMVKGDVSQSKLYKEINSDAPSAKKLARLLRKAECNYLVLPSSLALDDALSELSFVKVEETAGYTVYFDEENSDG